MPKYLTYDDMTRIMDNREKLPYSEEVMKKIFHAVRSFYRSFNNQSKIDTTSEEGGQILNFYGMNGKKTRHLLNNLLEFPNAVYLEIGSLYGACSISAIYKNKVHALFIDNWNLFYGDPHIFQKNLETYIRDDSVYQIINNDYWMINTDNLYKDFNIYYYDGLHTEEDHYKALFNYYINMQNTFIYVVNYWGWPEVRRGTWKAIKELYLKVRYCHELFVSEEEKYKFPNHHGKHTWWNGICIFVFEK